MEEKIPDHHPALAWMADYAAVLLNRIEFDEQVLFWRHSSGGQLAKLSSTWEDGVLIGVRSVSAEMLVGSAAEV